MRTLGFGLLIVALASGAFAGAASANGIRSSVDAATLPDAKRTSLGLYLTPADAAAAVQADPAILFLDVRDLIEIAFVGHPTPVDAIVPFEVATHEFDEAEGGVRMEPNTAFVAQVERVLARQRLGRDAPIFVMCRSGGRSAAAVNALAAAGYTNVWNLTEGFEGDKDASGARALNGWRNAGLPWTWRITREQAWSR
jgi:rhodanese-related sulfurtransferase